MIREGNRLQILCLSGGGFRGLFTAIMLDKICRGRGISDLRDHFDLIIGTSTGGLIASAVALGIPPSSIITAFRKYGRQIFPRNSPDLLAALSVRPQYSPAGIEGAVKELVPEFHQSNIEDLSAPLALVALSRIRQRHVVFAAKPFASYGIKKTSLMNAILATTAAPTFFPEQSLDSDCLIDGGLVANAPVLIGASLLRSKYRVRPEDVHVLHVGTASTTSYERFGHSWTERIPGIGWYSRFRRVTRELVTLMMAAQEAMAIELAKTWLNNRYVYIDAPEKLRQGPELSRLDDASVEARKRLAMLAEETWLAWKDEPRLLSFFPIEPPNLSPPTRQRRLRTVY